jgi:hypothetical protein
VPGNTLKGPTSQPGYDGGAGAKLNLNNKNVNGITSELLVEFLLLSAFGDNFSFTILPFIVAFLPHRRPFFVCPRTLVRRDLLTIDRKMSLTGASFRADEINYFFSLVWIVNAIKNVCQHVCD